MKRPARPLTKMESVPFALTVMFVPTSPDILRIGQLGISKSKSKKTGAIQAEKVDFEDDRLVAQMQNHKKGEVARR